MEEEEEVNNERGEYTLVVRKPCFGLPTACPSCLSLYIYLKFAQLPFLLDFNSTYPDSGIQRFIYLFIFCFLSWVLEIKEALVIRDSGWWILRLWIAVSLFFIFFFFFLNCLIKYITVRIFGFRGCCLAYL
jgi:hypothetical protein